MKKIDGWLKKYSNNEKEKRTFEIYSKERYHYEEMSEGQLNEHYITNKSKYEYKKTILTLCGITIFLTILFGTWETFLDIVTKVLEFSIKDNYNPEVPSITLLISMFLVLIIVIILFSLLISYVKNIYIVYRKVLLIENIIETKKD